MRVPWVPILPCEPNDMVLGEPSWSKHAAWRNESKKSILV